ncbi:MAG: bacterial Ig-like domain-containing protein [Treponema sp.]|nr:bacterial Ig-like domain-containing protein [Treponema sp.]
MKKLRFVKALFAAASLALAIPGCSDLSTGSSTEQTAGKGVVTISADVASAARTALPSAGAIDLTQYTFTLTATAEDSTTAVTGLPTDVAYSALSTAFTMAEGTYNFTLTATNATSGAKLAGTLSSIEISDATTATLAFTLYGVAADSATGSLVIKVTYEDGYGATTVTPTLYSEGGTSLDSTYPLTYTADTETAGTGTITGTVPAGASYVGIVLSDGSQTLGSIPKETVYAVKGVTSTSDVTIPVTQYKATVNVTNGGSAYTTATTVTLKMLDSDGAELSETSTTKQTLTQTTGTNSYTGYVPVGSYNVYVGTTKYGTLSNATEKQYDIATIKSIVFDFANAKTTYSIGDEFDSTGVTATVTYENDSTASISASDLTFDGFDSAAAGSQTITVTYTGYTGTYTNNTYAVTIKGLETLTWDFSTAAVTMYSDENCTTAVEANTSNQYVIQYSSSATATNYAYLKGTSDASTNDAAVMYVETPISGSKIAIRSSDVQVNTGALFYIPVSSGSVVTVTQRTAGSYELGGQESLTYTANAAGYVVYDVLSGYYLSSISVTNVKTTDEHTTDVVSFVPKTDKTTANTTSVLGFTATSVESDNTDVVTADLTSNSGYITFTSKTAGTATITASGSGDETTSWTVTVRRYGNIVVGGITPYTSETEVTSIWLKTSSGDAVTVKGGQVTVAAGKFVYLNKQFAAGTKVRIEATTASYTSGAKTLNVGFIENPANVSSANGIYTTASGANSGKPVGQSTNGFGGAVSGTAPYRYVTEYTFASSSTATTSSHYIYDAASTSANTTYLYKTGVTPANSTVLSSGYAIFGDTASSVIFTLIEVYADDELVYSSATSETGELPSSTTLTFLNGDSDITVGYTVSSGTYTFTASAPSSGSYTYSWYVDLVKQESTANTCEVSLATGNHAILVTATDTSTGVVYSAQSTLSVE